IVAGNGNNVVFGDNGRITSARADAPQIPGLAITLGLVETIQSLIGGSDSITTGVGIDIVLGGIDADTLFAGEGRNIVIGDSGYIDWTAGDAGRFYAAVGTPVRATLSGDDSNALDIDRIFSTQPGDGGIDTITTGAGDDLIIGGQGVDTIVAGNGDNLVFGDNGQVTAATSDLNRFTSWTITLGLVETIQSLIGGADSITTGLGIDILLGGIGGDTLFAGEGSNIVIGDSGYIDWTAGDVGRFYAATTFARGTLSGDDSNALDIDRIFSTQPGDGGIDTITTGAGDDLIIGGQAGDTIVAGNGDNLVFGDNGQVTAAASDLNRFTSWTITLGLVETIQSLIGGADSITTGLGIDILLGGIGGDTLFAGEGRNIVIGDSGYIDWTAGDVGRFYAAVGAPVRATLSGDDSNALDIDRIFSTEPNDGGNDTITTGAGDDLIIGGQG